MKDFGLVVIGAHFGVWLEKEISKFKDQNILLVEPVPYNVEILKKKYGEFDNIYICNNAIFSEKKQVAFIMLMANQLISWVNIGLVE